MSGLRVERRPSTERGRLYPKYVNSVGILVLQSAERRGWPYGFTIDGSLTLDIDEDCLLANVELMVPMSGWKPLRPFPEVPAARRRADLAFTAETCRLRSYDAHLRVQSDSGKYRLLISLADVTERAQAIELSERCFALVEAGELRAFHVSLAAHASANALR